MKKTLNTLAKIGYIKIVSLVFALSVIFGPVAFADIGNNSFDAWDNAVFQKGVYDIRSYNHVSTGNLVLSTTVLLTGCLTEVCGTQEVGAIPKAGDIMVAMMETPPASGLAYMGSIYDNLNIVKPALAQEGIGYQVLQPILPLWRAMRNLAYMAFIIVFIVIGLSIMFRVRLSPQTTISIQSALPGIIVALLFVTFSYAIAGLLIDLSYVLFYVIVWALQIGSEGVITPDQAQAAIDDYTSGSIWSTVTAVAGQGVGAILKIVGGLIPGI